MSRRPIFTPQELAEFQRAAEYRVRDEAFRKAHPEYFRDSEVRQFIEEERAASLRDCPPPLPPQPDVTTEQCAGMDDVADWSAQ